MPNPCDICKSSVASVCGINYGNTSPPCSRNTASCQTCHLNVLAETEFNLKKISDKNLIILEKLVEEEQQVRKMKRVKITKLKFIHKVKK
jgi:hypothetical protein